MHLSSLLVLSLSARSVLAGMTLQGFTGCKGGEESAIVDAWHNSREIVDATRGKIVDWNEAAALEYLGPPAFNARGQQAIQEIYNKLYEITDRADTPEAKKVHVRCDDPLNQCAGSDLVSAYATQESQNGGVLAAIHFCPRYFTYPHLQTVMDTQGRNTNLREKFNLQTYDLTKAYVFLHEMLHIHWVTNSGRFGDHQPVVDLWMTFKEAGSDEEKRVRVYGPKYAKILARWDSSSTLGGFIARSDESLGLYLLAKFVQQQFRSYPHRPVINTDPAHAPEVPRHGEVFEVDDNGNVFWNMSYVIDDPRQGMGSVEDTESIPVTRFISNSELPESYNNDWHSWAVEDDTPAPAPSPTEPTSAPPPPPPEPTPIEPPGFEKIGAPQCAEGSNNGSPLSIVKGQCVKVWDGYSSGGEDWSAQYQPNSPYNCGNNCFSYPKGFGRIQAFGDGTYGTNCEYFSDLNCQSSIGKTGNVVSVKKDGIKVLDEASGQKGFSMQCFFHC